MNLRLSALSLAALALAGAAGTASPAHAASYTIATSGNFALTSVGTAFRVKCDPAIASSPANGLDARILDGAPFSGRTVTLTWSGAAPTGYLGTTFYDASCVPQYINGTPDPWVRTPSKTFGVPAGTRWLVVEAQLTANVTFSIS